MKKFRTISLYTLLLALSLAGRSQKNSASYDILRNEKKVGRIVFSQTSSGKSDSLKLEGKVNAKLITNFVAEVIDKAVFNNGVLVESSIYRQVNGTEKANKTHHSANGKYLIKNGKRSKDMTIYPIRYTMLSLFSSEPIGVSKVYSDNFERMIPIEKIESHKYKVSLPDDSYNQYYYKDGMLTVLEIHHPLYSAKMVLSR